MGRVIVIAQARMGSSRLPGKVLRKAGELSLLEHLARRLRRAKTPDELVLATTEEAGDDELARAARAQRLRVYRGPVDDVLARFCGALASLDAAPEDIVVRVTADCPLLDPGEIDRLVAEFRARRGTPEALDYLSNQGGEQRRIPRGLDVELCSVAALVQAGAEATRAGDREHVTPYLYRVPGRFRVALSHPPGLAGEDLSHLRLTVDTPADLELVDAVVGALGPDASTAEIAAYLGAHPEIAAKNAAVRQKSIDADMEARAARVAGKRLLARADAGGATGFGHATRIGALLDAWIELGGRATLVGRGVVGAVRERLVAAGVELVEGGDAAFEARIAGADALAADGYAFGREHQHGWQAQKPLLAIDDLAAHEQLADLVVNQILDFDAERYVCAPYTRLLIGHPYVLLRREFRRPLALQGQGQGGPRVLLSFGGTDPAGLSAPFAEALLARLGPGVRLQLIVGTGVGAEARARLDALAAAHARALELHVDVREMAALLAGASLCICAAGTTVWEAMACGVPVATVAVAENQRPVLAGLESRAAGLSLGWHEELDLPEAARTIAELLADPECLARLAAAGRATVDGRGVYRVLDALLDLLDLPDRVDDSRA